jgi:hypothetical protein
MLISNFPAACEVDELEIARELVRQARDAGVALTSPCGLLNAMTKTVIETALEEDFFGRFGYDRHAPGGQWKWQLPQRSPLQDRVDGCVRRGRNRCGDHLRIPNTGRRIQLTEDAAYTANLTDRITVVGDM